MPPGGRWLQRDFGIYVVNMFDTAEAAGVLQLPKASLRGLLLHFCGIEVPVLPTCPRSPSPMHSRLSGPIGRQRLNDAFTGIIAKTSVFAALDSVVAGSWSLKRGVIDQYFIGKHACGACQLPAARGRFRQVGPAPCSKFSGVSRRKPSHAIRFQ